MYLRKLRLRTFRSHAETEVGLSKGITLFVGPNGVGKTNLLEAVSVLCMGRSFLGASDRHVLRRGDSFYEVRGEFEGSRRSSFRLQVAYSRSEGKRAFVNGSPLERLAELIGMAPLVVLSPSDYELTAGGPSERRRFLDALLSQSYPIYLKDLLTYRRALKQRNSLLRQVRRGASFPRGTVDAWGEEIVQIGARIVARRRAFLERFTDFVDQAYELLDEPGASPSLTYQASTGDHEDADSEEERFRRALSRKSQAERERGRTLVGPHLDEVMFRLGKFALRPYASQGQHRTFSLAIRLASALFLKEHLEESPVLLLDDVFGTLDPGRASLVLALLAGGEMGQSIATATHAEVVTPTGELPEGPHHIVNVREGAIPARSPARAERSRE